MIEPAGTDPGSAAHAAAGRPPVVVVGVDGSVASRQALLFAAREAQLRQAVLYIVAAYDATPDRAGDPGSWPLGWDLVPIGNRLCEAAERVVQAAADAVATELPGPPVHLSTMTLQGRASQVLLTAAGEAEAVLLVVGVGSAGPLTRLVMGSTSTEVVHHAHLPVTVVPGAVPLGQATVRQPARTA